MNIAAVVPSLNPDKQFTKVVDELVEAGFTRIYVINDGSDDSFLPYFEAAARHPQCVVLRHAQNRGKGRALKTAFEAHLQDPGDYTGLVTLDGDGQHATADVLKVAAAMQQHPGALVLGARDFSQQDVPARSSFGNKITRSVFKATFGFPVTDTQTGLRGIPNAFAQALLEVQGERYEFEMNMLIATKEHSVPVVEVPISTIYLDNNAASHFHPIKDSIRIYARILKYTASSLASFLVDYSLFLLFNWLLKSTALDVGSRLLAATVGARVCSALFNFFINKKLVFSSKARTGGTLLRYAILSVVQMGCSYGGVYLLSAILPVPEALSKILVDTTLFFLSFFVQRRWVFHTRQKTL